MSWTLDTGLADLSCGGLLIRAESARDPDVARFVGKSHIGECFLVLPAGGNASLGYLTPMERQEAAATGLKLLDPALLEVDRLRSEHGFGGAFWSALLARGLALAGLAPCRVALAGHAALGPAHGALVDLESKGWRFVDGRDLLLRHRKRKSTAEIAATRRSSAGVCEAFHRCASVLADAEVNEGRLDWRKRPLTAGLLRGEIAAVLAAHGLDEPGDNIVATGTEAAVPHTQGGNDRVLRAGETIVVDLFPKGEMFADCTRTFCVGEPSAGVTAAHALVREALELARGGAREGVRGWDLQKSVCDLLAASGLPTPLSDPGTTSGYVHGLGHGVGYEIHEYPSFASSSGAEGVLEVGDLFTLEPGLYDPSAAWGIRLEDLCLLTETSVEVLTPLPYHLDPRRW